MRIDVLTLFPEIFDGFLSESLLKRAMRNGLIEVHRWNIRRWSKDKHQKVDDRPYGGGPGMVIRPDVVFECVESVQKEAAPGRLVLLSPGGRRLTQRIVEELAREPRLLLLCGRYEGFDDRIRLGLAPLEISIGDYVTCGGEAPAMVLIECVARLTPGFLGDAQSAVEESFCEPGWIEYPQYTRPPEFLGMRVPDVLLGGDHKAIESWRRREAQRRSDERNRCDGRPESGGGS